MALYVKDPEVDRLATELAARRKTTKTEAIRVALVRELAASEPPLSERLQSLSESYRAFPLTGAEADKQFFDDLAGDA